MSGICGWVGSQVPADSVEHVIRAMAHDVVVMKDGAIVESGPVREVLDAPREDYTKTLVQAAS